ncbi:hypothetical protein ACFWNL_18415 [Kitasatospora sp. NPDC058397]|uniref:hypothetical protein n=1 Tax=unclassified Kitasatospora TaxID=2633591 RepID=UPI00364EF2B9
MSADAIAPGLPAYGLAISKINMRLAGGPMLLLALEPQSPAAGSAHLGECGWKPWRLSGFLHADELWAVVFDRRSRALVSVVRLAEDLSGIEYTLLAASSPVPLPPPMWDLVVRHERVVLCGPVDGDPTGAVLRAAEAAGTLRAVAATAAVL